MWLLSFARLTVLVTQGAASISPSKAQWWSIDKLNGEEGDTCCEFRIRVCGIPRAGKWRLDNDDGKGVIMLVGKKMSSRWILIFSWGTSCERKHNKIILHANDNVLL